MIRRWRKKRANRPDPNILIPPEGVPLHMRVAGVGVRMGAQIIDVLLTVAAMIAVLVLFAVIGSISFSTFGAIAAFLFFFIRIPYYVLSELAWNGQTIGKRMTSIRVVAHDGGSLSPHALVARNLMKEAEVFLPGTLVFALSTSEPVTSLIAAVWIIAALAVPLMNPRRRRLGDMIAGTYVIHLPVAVLAKDMAVPTATNEQTESTFVFLNHQLDHYGAYELQTLETLLRAQERPLISKSDGQRREATLADVVSKIRMKIGYSDKVEPGHTLTFLNAFYKAQRAHLEQRQMFGDRRVDKFHGEETTEKR